MILDSVRRAGRLLIFVLLVPLLGVGAAAAVRAQNQRSLTEAVWLGRAGPADATGGRTLADVCGAADAAASDVCRHDRWFVLFGRIAAWTAVAGVLLLAAIAIAGKGAERSSGVLLTLFRPGLYATAAGTTALIVMHAVVAVSIIMAITTLVMGRMSPAFAGAILIGAAAGVMAVPRSVFGAVQTARVFVLGGLLTPEAAPELWRRVTDTASRLGALPPDTIVGGLDVNFFVTEAEVETPNGPCRGRTLFCSLPLARILSVDEFMAIVGHELGHFRGDDLAVSRQFYPIYRGTESALEALAESGGGVRSVPLLPALAILDFFLDRFAVAERSHARRRELLADAAGVEATSVRTMATALAKSHAWAPLWPEAIAHAAVLPLRDDEPVPNASRLFASDVARRASADAFEGVGDTHTSHPTDSHPTLAVRLAALGVDLAAIVPDALRVEPEAPAIGLIPEADLHEEAQSALVSLSVAHRGPGEED